MAYKRCTECGQPMLKRGQKRKHSDDYRHARGCPLVSAQERKSTEAHWAKYEGKDNEILATRKARAMPQKA